VALPRKQAETEKTNLLLIVAEGSCLLENNVALPGNQAETENTNINLKHQKKLIYSTVSDIRKISLDKHKGRPYSHALKKEVLINHQFYQ
jgi:hypothetical protein